MFWMWFSFVGLVLALLALDVGVFHRQARAVKSREALGWTAVWIGAALAFNAFVYFAYEYHWLGITPSEEVPDGRTAALLFFTGYVVEKSLSVDNLFVIAMIFSAFHVAPVYQHRVLFWGILGALVMRCAMILAGSVLIEHYHWVLYLFGVFLVVTAARMMLVRKETRPEKGFLVRTASRLLPVTEQPAEERFIVCVNGRWMLTPLALALVAVESTDLMFAVDSIPAIFAIAEDPFIVFSSNIFAVFGLRSLYFALAELMHRFYYAKTTLVVLLAAIGMKMLLKDVLHPIPGITYYTLAAVAMILGTGVIASVIRESWTKRHARVIRVNRST
jgi:tellurite resistance protein TerC